MAPVYERRSETADPEIGVLKKRETVEVRKLMTLLLNNSKALLTRYNQVEILNNGEETFPALFGALKNAKVYPFGVLYYRRREIGY